MREKHKKKLIKKIAVSSAMIGIIGTTGVNLFTPIMAKASLVDTIEIENMEVVGDSVYYTVDGNRYEYNVMTEVLSVNGEKSVRLETKVEYLNPELDITESEALAQEKESILRNLKEFNNTDNDSSRSGFPVNNVVPSTAAYVVSSSFSKNIAQVYGELGSGLTDISALTTVLTLTKGVPYKTILGTVATATGLASYVVEKTKGYVGGKWEYSLQQTKNKYPLNGVDQYAYRYAHAGISLNLKIGNTTYTPYSSYTARGDWWI